MWKKRKQYTKEYKVEAVRLIVEDEIFHLLVLLQKVWCLLAVKYKTRLGYLLPAPLRNKVTPTKTAVSTMLGKITE